MFIITKFNTLQTEFLSKAFSPNMSNYPSYMYFSLKINNDIIPFNNFNFFSTMRKIIDILNFVDFLLSLSFILIIEINIDFPLEVK